MPRLPVSNIKLPEGSCDCHVHIYGPLRAVSGLAQEADFSPTQANPVESLFAMWDTIGVARGVIVHALAAGADNEVTLERTAPLSATSARRRDPEARCHRSAARRTDHAGFKGVRINLLRRTASVCRPAA